MKLFPSFFNKKTPQADARGPVASPPRAEAPVIFVKSPEELLNYLKPRGRALVVNHWATWCDPCISELPYLAAISLKYKDRADFVAVSWERFTDDSPEGDVARTIRETAARFSIYYENVVAPPPPEEVFRVLNLQKPLIPQTFIYNAGGNCIFEHCGPVDSGAPRSEFEKMLQIAAGDAHS